MDDMKILAIENELDKNIEGNISELYEEEALHVYNLYKDDVIREIYFNQDKCAVIILECKNIEEAKSIIDGFPLVQAGLIEFAFHALTPYTGYDRLIV